jgi:hypothetical protein
MMPVSPSQSPLDLGPLGAAHVRRHVSVSSRARVQPARYLVSSLTMQAVCVCTMCRSNYQTRRRSCIASRSSALLKGIPVPIRPKAALPRRERGTRCTGIWPSATLLDQTLITCLRPRDDGVKVETSEVTYSAVSSCLRLMPGPINCWRRWECGSR